MNPAVGHSDANAQLRVQAPLLDVSSLTVGIRGRAGTVYPVKGFSMIVRAGDRLALVGESGCGKSLSALAIMRLLPRAARVESGRVLLDGLDILQVPDRSMTEIRGRRIAMVSQNPMSALNPLQTIEQQLVETLRLDTSARRPKLRMHARDLLQEVGLRHPEQRLGDYPHQLSGGMRQRVVLAIALARNPDLLIADEPTTALDVTTQDRIVRLLVETVVDRNMAFIFITHDLGIASQACANVHVMYAGRGVEQASATDFFSHPIHPYSEALLASVCRLDQPLDSPLTVPPGNPPLPGLLPPGCPFHPRCVLAVERCKEMYPADIQLSGEDRFAACHFALDRSAQKRGAQ